MRWALAALGGCLAGHAVGASDCEFRREAGESHEDDEEWGGDTMLWGGWDRSCADLHCDAATGTLWVSVRNQLEHMEREKSSKGHRKVRRSYCMALAATGEYARYAKAEISAERQECFFV